MKVFIVVAGALLLSTPALAYDAGKLMDAKARTVPVKMEPAKPSSQMKKAVLAVLSDSAMGAKTRPASAGMGGPIAETGYPPCSRTVTDHCVQLYERGVTGAGN